VISVLSKQYNTGIKLVCCAIGFSSMTSDKPSEEAKNLKNHMISQTRLLRDGNAEVHRRIRELLALKGINTATMIVASFYDDGGRFFGIIVTQDKRVFTFDFSQKIPITDGDFIKWLELTDRLQDNLFRYYKYHAEVAFQLLEEGFTQ
jgi:hypothetical protein